MFFIKKKLKRIADSAVVVVPKKLGKRKADERAVMRNVIVMNKGHFSLSKGECITNLLHHLKREEDCSRLNVFQL